MSDTLCKVLYLQRLCSMLKCIQSLECRVTQEVTSVNVLFLTLITEVAGNILNASEPFPPEIHDDS